MDLKQPDNSPPAAPSTMKMHTLRSVDDQKEKKGKVFKHTSLFFPPKQYKCSNGECNLSRPRCLAGNVVDQMSDWTATKTIEAQCSVTLIAGETSRQIFENFCFLLQ
jgi:hypothetical protein